MEQGKKRQTKKILFGIVALLLVIGALCFVYTRFAAKPVEGSKTITVAVVHGDGSQKGFELSTDAEYLRQALEEENLIAGEESQYGLFLQTVDGETADESLQQWWCITKDGESLNTGVDTTPVFDGDAFELTLKTGW